jgi:hypothetical protein
MKVGGGFHLTYCSNIHPGETWPQVSAVLAEALPRVRELLTFDGPFAIGLRLSAQAAETLATGDALDTFRAFLQAGNYYVPTINGFPYGAFHGERVKERVYLPDWRDDARVQYSNRLATILSRLLADRPDVDGSVSTAPGAFRAHVRSKGDVQAIADGIRRHAEHLVRIRETTGRTITLAIEPEPAWQAVYDDGYARYRALYPAYAIERCSFAVTPACAETMTVREAAASATSVEMRFFMDISFLSVPRRCRSCRNRRAVEHDARFERKQ